MSYVASSFKHEHAGSRQIWMSLRAQHYRRGAPEGANGRRFRIHVIDDVTKECLAAVADTSISGRRVVRELNAVIAWRGRPDHDRLGS
jgi:transposase InsO family protein